MSSDDWYFKSEYEDEDEDEYEDGDEGEDEGEDEDEDEVDWIFIENTSKSKVLGATNDGEVILEVEKKIVKDTNEKDDEKDEDEKDEDDNEEQLWEKGEPNAEGYFTLENCNVPAKFLTAISSTRLSLKGNIS